MPNDSKEYPTGSLVRVIRPFRFGGRVFDVGEVGEVVEVDRPLTFRWPPSSQPEQVYYRYVKFEAHRPIGVHEKEIEPIKEGE